MFISCNLFQLIYDSLFIINVQSVFKQILNLCHACSFNIIGLNLPFELLLADTGNSLKSEIFSFCNEISFKSKLKI